jgi:hypothetical protein
MRRVPSCLVFTAFLSLAGITSETALAEPGFRHGGPAFHGTRHARTSFGGRWAGPRQGYPGNQSRWGYGTPFPRHSEPLPHPHRRVHRFHQRHYGHHRGFHRFHGYGGYGGYGFSSHRLWSYLDSYGDVTLPVIHIDAPLPPVIPAVPSLADLPGSTGIRSTPAASPAVYVLGSGRASDRGSAGGRGATSLNADDAEREDRASGPRIIPLDVPRGR